MKRMLLVGATVVLLLTGKGGVAEDGSRAESVVFVGPNHTPIEIEVPVKWKVHPTETSLDFRNQNGKLMVKVYDWRFRSCCVLGD